MRASEQEPALIQQSLKPGEMVRAETRPLFRASRAILAHDGV
jgi:hypothetical protein